MIPKRFIRVWVGPKPIPELFEKWWIDFQKIHPDYSFVTIADSSRLLRRRPSNEKHQYVSADSFWKSSDTPYHHLHGLYKDASTYSGRSDYLRLIALYELGGIYVDTDMMPLKSFAPLLEDDRTFVGLRSAVSFATGVIGGRKGANTFEDAFSAFPAWLEAHKDRSCSVATGPGFISNVWFGREDVNHMPIGYFYPYNGFGQPKKDVRLEMFSTKDFPDEMYAAHFGNHGWGGKPKD